MTLDQACVLAKEITIGKGVACTVHAHRGNGSVVCVQMNGRSNKMKDEIMQLGISRGHKLSQWKQEVNFA